MVQRKQACVRSLTTGLCWVVQPPVSWLASPHSLADPSGQSMDPHIQPWTGQPRLTLRDSCVTAKAPTAEIAALSNNPTLRDVPVRPQELGGRKSVIKTGDDECEHPIVLTQIESELCRNLSLPAEAQRGDHMRICFTVHCHTLPNARYPSREGNLSSMPPDTPRTSCPWAVQ